MIVILDYEMGNVGSIQNMLRKIGVREVTISRDAGDIRRADRLILPGVGAFDAGMERLREFGLPDLIREHALGGESPGGSAWGCSCWGRTARRERSPAWGCCPFPCKRFDFPPETALKIPHMGWDRTYVRIQTPLTEGLEPRERYYYVHSYHAACEDPALVLMECEYGYRFPSAVYGGSVYGVQFHPEKSHLYGMKLLKNFAERC
ncbi:imidazole glycerol phosphate synthase subunit HisH [Dysosmobacter welbionis]|uniref:imidazole glycerol phosphate synthase subunit HisH n=1 Tax=Dysosmobacter welbionis TaxID=2093857 RepID=UPI002356101B|nr:imidazole glycerol phosphate synthase subunit HisH [Dysosmobacter welbionis]